MAYKADHSVIGQRGAANSRTPKHVTAFCAVALGFVLALGAIGCSSTTTDETGSETDEATTTVSAERSADPTSAGDTDIPTGDLDGTDPAESNQAVGAETPEREHASQEAQPVDGRAEDSEPAEDRDGPDAHTEDPERSPVVEGEDEDSDWAVRSTDNPHRFNARFDHDGGKVIAPWLVPWKDGFLQVGHPMIGDVYWDESRFFFRVSADGLEWTDFGALDVPQEHSSQSFIIGEPPYWLQRCAPVVDVASTGDRLVVAVAWPQIDTRGDHCGSDVIDGPIPYFRVYVSVTDDLMHWDVREIVISRPDFLHDSLQLDVEVTDLEVTQSGWLLEAVTSAHLNLLALLPEEFRRSATRIRPFGYDEEGVTFEWTPIAGHESTGAGPRTSLFSWKELGTTLNMYLEYGIDGMVRNKPYIPPWQMHGSVWVAAWGEDPVRTELPHVDRCCSIAPTGDGYVGLSDHSIGGYVPWRFGPASLVFSSDGLSWKIIGPIDGEELWLYGIGSVNGGVLLYGSEDTSSSESGSMSWGIGTRLLLLGSPDGSEFYEIDLAEGASLPQCLMMLGKAPVGWPGTAVNGDTLLTFGEGGTIERYEALTASDGAVRPDVCTADTKFTTSLVVGQAYGELRIDHHNYDSFLRNKANPAVLPWRDGFLEFGHPSDPRPWSGLVDRTRLIMRVSADGFDWTSVQPFPVPFESLLVDGAPQIPSPIHDVTSDGRGLVFGLQQDDIIYVSITEDLIDWETVEIVPPPVEGLIDGATVSAIVEQVIIGPDGWLLRTSTPGLTSGDVWSAAWGEEPSRAALPEVDGGTCCDVVGTRAGYVALADLDSPWQQPVMFFSPDGSSWSAVDSPATSGLEGGLTAVEGGVLVIGRSRSDRPTQLWLGDATGSNWRLVELPLPPGHWEIRLWGDGRGAVGLAEGFLADHGWDSYVIGSTDGVNWLAERFRSAWDHRWQINGNLIVGVRHNGEIRRFVIP